MNIENEDDITEELEIFLQTENAKLKADIVSILQTENAELKAELQQIKTEYKKLKRQMLFLEGKLEAKNKREEIKHTEMQGLMELLSDLKQGDK